MAFLFTPECGSIFPFCFAKGPGEGVPANVREALFPTACCWMDRRTIPSAALRGQGGFPVKKLFSIRKLQKMMILLFLVPMLLLQVVQSFYFLRVLSEEMAQNGREILSLHQNALDDDISRIADSISSYWALDYSHSKLLYPQSDFNAYQYSYSVLKEYRSLMSIEPSIGALLHK